MRFLLMGCLFIFASNLGAQGVLVAWHLGQAPVVIELTATKNLPAMQISGEFLPSLPTADYELILYQVENRQQRLTLMRELNANKKVKFVELDAEVYTPSGLLAPSHFKQLDLLDTSGYPIQYACENFPIAIIDTGINTLHPSLGQLNLFDVRKNYINNYSDKNAEDDDGHGTHIAGLIAAFPTQYASGFWKKSWVAGICSTATLHNMKALPKRMSGSLSNVYAAFLDAANGGVERFPIINASIETNNSRSLRDVIKQLDAQGQFIVAAAGNDGALMDNNPRYPAAYTNDFETVISVANTDANNRLATSSNYSYQLVDFAAPGEALLSTWLNNNNGEGLFKVASGTSMATPLVSATLAALMQKYQYFNLPPAAFRAALINSLTLDIGLEKKLRYSGILNTGAALEANAQDLFKPTWFNFDWVDYTDAIYLKGYLLNEVTSVVFINESSTSRKILDFSYDTEKKGLLINLPKDWREGYLQLTASTQNLARLDFTVMTNKALPLDALICENDDCSIIWNNYQVNVIRQDGNKNTPWWLASRLQAGEEVLVITGTDLSANWQFSFSGPPRLSLVALQVDKKGEGLQNLTLTDGYQLNTNTHSANWYLDQPEKWSIIQAPLQQLVLLPKIETKNVTDEPDYCYIATAVYGDPFAPEVMLLRQFRDKFLMKFSLGRQFVSVYYAYSPDFVAWMEDKPRLQSLIRWSLNLFISVYQFLLLAFFR